MRSKKLLGELLVEAGLASPEQIEEALATQRELKERLGQILIQAGHITEEQLVETLSRQLQVAIAPETRLRQVRPTRQALYMVSPEVAKQARLLPIFYNEQERSLSLVVSDPQNLDILAQIKAQNDLSRLRVLLAGDSLLDELISIHYGGQGLSQQGMALGPSLPHMAQSPLLLLEPDTRKAQAMGHWLGAEGYSVLHFRDVDSLKNLKNPPEKSLLIIRQGLADADTKEAEELFPPDRIRRLPPARELVEEGGSPARFVDFYLKTIDFFFSLLEEDKEAPSRRHIRHVSQMARAVAQRVGLTDRQRDTIAVASYLYQFDDYLTKHGIFGQDPGNGERKVLAAELWSSFDPPLPVDALLRDLVGNKGNKGERLDASVLRAVSTYVEMRDGSRRYAKVGHQKALRFLKDEGDKQFPTIVVDAIQELLAKEHLLDQIEGSESLGNEVLLVDKDRTSLRSLELRFVKEGFRVRTARTGEEALRMIEQQQPTLVISEVTLPRVDGFELCAKLKASQDTRELPFIFLSARADTYHVTKGLDLGADDFLTKPVNLEILMTKVRRLERVLEDRQRPVTPGVQGSLSEMGLFDLLQVLQMGMKTALVTLNKGLTKCELYLSKGKLVAAIMGDLTGRDAFFELCTWENGSFAVTPGTEAPQANLHDSNDFLLMEGMRRADELRAGIGE